MAVSRIIYQARPEYYQDCLEFVKHTGKVDEQKIRGIEFNIKLKGTTPIEDLVPLTYERPLLKRLLAGVLGEFRMVGHHSMIEFQSCFLCHPRILVVNLS